MKLACRMLSMIALMASLLIPARATINTTASSVTDSCDGSNTSFSFSFPTVNAGDISVIVTNSSGVATTLTASQYTLTLNAAPLGQIWGLGGSVSYPKSGGPCPLGSLLTIVRTLPLTQGIVLSNQGTIVPKSVEQGLDIGTMQTQQVEGQIGRAISVAPSDPPPNALPPAAQRANQALVFDGSGNPVAGAIPSSGVISSAMQPVVGASTLALGRTAFGLGAAATEGIGAGLQDDGSGNLRAIFIPVADSTSQAVDATFHLTERHATGALTYTNPAASTLFAGFGYWVYALNNPITFAIDAGDSFSGMASGTSFIIAPGSRVFISTDGVSTWFARSEQFVGMNSPLNLQINAAVAANALTISLKTANGNDPSTNSPVLLAFRDPTATNGNPVIRAATGALSITVPSGATLGTSNGVPFRVWVVLFDNAGTLVPAVIVCSTATRIYPLVEGATATATAITSGATSAGVFYGSAGVSSKSFRILGYVDFGSGQSTAGTWASADTGIVLFGPGIKKPGDVVQTIYATTSSTQAVSSTAKVATALTGTITPTSAVNFVKIQSYGWISNNSQTNAHGVITQLYRSTGATAVGNSNVIAVGAGAIDNAIPTVNFAFDNPGSASSTQYGLYIALTTGTDTWTFLGTNAGSGTSGATMLIEEIMGALDDPANDNINPGTFSLTG